MKEVHFVVQGKGGVGKSFVANLLAQYLGEHSDTAVHCFDTDPVNPTFSRIRALNVKTVDILTEHNTIDTRRFDDLVETLADENGIAVIDNGAATFIPLMAYLAESGLISALQEAGMRVFMHVPINGGNAQDDCVMGLVQTVKTAPAPVVVWLNHFKGHIGDKGKPFTEFKAYTANRAQILGIVELPNRNPDTFGKDIALMTEMNLTFAEIAHNPDFKIMERSRLNTVRREVYEQLSAIPFEGGEQAARAG